MPLALSPAAARHVQVLRMQPGDTLTLFNGEGGQWSATVVSMGRSEVRVQVGAHQAIECEAPRAVRLALGVPANDRMDWLVEKATELGVAAIQPLQTAHSVLRLGGERATKKQSHWQSVAIAACEQCGGNRVPQVLPWGDAATWLRSSADRAPRRYVLSLAHDAQPLAPLLQANASPAAQRAPLTFFSGPEGGLSPQEETMARASGFIPVTLGPRVLRAETAALTALTLAMALG